MMNMEKPPRYDPEGEPSDNLYVMGLPEAFDTDSVQQFFGAIGTVTQCKSFGNGYALVRFATVQEAMTVKLSLSGQKPIGCTKPLVITFAVSEKKNDWTCPRCGDLQFQKNTQCRMCGCPRPQGADEMGALALAPVAVLPGMPKYAEGGDWTCASCGDLQFKRNTSCRLCGTPAPGAGGAAADTASLPMFGKAKGKGKAVGAVNPYPAADAKGKGTGKVKGGPMCSIVDFISELITGGLPGGDVSPDTNCIFVSGLPPDCTNENLYQIFATFGPMPPKGGRIDKDATGACAGSAFVNFIEGASADMAVMALNGIALSDGQQLNIRRHL